MTTSPARLLILSCGAVMALFDVIALLPGNPVVNGHGGFLFTVAAQALIIIGLLRRSSIAWLLLVIASSLYALAFILVQAPWQTTFVLTAVAASTQVAVVCTPPVLAYVFGRDLV